MNFMMSVYRGNNNNTTLSCFLASYKTSFKEIKYYNSGSSYNLKPL